MVNKENIRQQEPYLCSLIDRLREKYPKSDWSVKGYYFKVWQWKGKEKELEMKLNNN